MNEKFKDLIFNSNEKMNKMLIDMLILQEWCQYRFIDTKFGKELYNRQSKKGGSVYVKRVHTER